jgi:maleylacetoacetate isomerase
MAESYYGGLPMLKLYSYFRSSASYRVRIALHWKKIKFEYIPIHLLKDGGQQNKPEYRKVNPMGHVPALDHDGFLVAESMAIIQYLDDAFPGAKLFPTAAKDRAQVMQICEAINSGIQPLQNLKVQQTLEGQFGLAKADSDAFVRHWIATGLANLEKLLAQTAGRHCFGDGVTAADCFVIPQCFASRRFGVEVEQFPTLARVNKNGIEIEAFKLAHPEKQPDYQA